MRRLLQSFLVWTQVILVMTSPSASCFAPQAGAVVYRCLDRFGEKALAVEPLSARHRTLIQALFPTWGMTLKQSQREIAPTVLAPITLHPRKQTLKDMDTNKEHVPKKIGRRVYRRQDIRIFLETTKSPNRVWVLDTLESPWGHHASIIPTLVQSLFETWPALQEVVVQTSYPELVEHLAQSKRIRTVSPKVSMPQVTAPDLIVSLSRDAAELESHPDIDALVDLEKIVGHPVGQLTIPESVYANLEAVGFSIPLPNKPLFVRKKETSVEQVLFINADALTNAMFTETLLESWANVIVDLNTAGYRVVFNKFQAQTSDRIQAAVAGRLRYPSKFEIKGFKTKSELYDFLSEHVAGVITIDTGLFHAARLFGIPTVVVTTEGSFVAATEEYVQPLSWNEFQIRPRSAVRLLSLLLPTAITSLADAKAPDGQEDFTLMEHRWQAHGTRIILKVLEPSGFQFLQCVVIFIENTLQLVGLDDYGVESPHGQRLLMLGPLNWLYAKGKWLWVRDSLVANIFEKVGFLPASLLDEGEPIISIQVNGQKAGAGTHLTLQQLARRWSWPELDLQSARYNGHLIARAEWENLIIEDGSDIDFSYQVRSADLTRAAA